MQRVQVFEDSLTYGMYTNDMQTNGMHTHGMYTQNEKWIDDTCDHTFDINK